MIGKIKRAFNLLHNMGWKYVFFRVGRIISSRSGSLKKQFPVAPHQQSFISLDDWKKQKRPFFFQGKDSIQFPRKPSPELKERFEQIINGDLLMFNSIVTHLGIDYDWVTNPDSGYRYDVHKHWTEIQDYSSIAGDIKYVWEKSRFSYLYEIIRYDYHFNDDQAELIFREINSWIDHNPVNCGPNYRCSQEMSLRVMNWTFALYYYKDSIYLSNEVFGKIQYAIYWHLDHIYKNIQFSRIAVRNNHAITETLMLYLGGLLFPFYPGAELWKKKGKKWFEEEIAYQVYEDGTFLQFSMNYHRVVVQLLTWSINLAEKNGEKFADVVYDRARKSVAFLRSCMVDENGWLPNYGANDGALFFKFSDAHYRDYRPALQALAMTLHMDLGFHESLEDSNWYGLGNGVEINMEFTTPAMGIHKFTIGGYYIIREPDTLTFIKCGGYKDRPSQADNLHLDIWYKGENMLIDAGSYKYNTDSDTIRYFSGTASHNTIMLNDNDQMLKGGRFIWYYWSRLKNASLKEDLINTVYQFDGEVFVYSYLNKNIVHSRQIIKESGQPVWHIKDTLINAPASSVSRQLWHLPKKMKYHLKLDATNELGEEILLKTTDGWYSSYYGLKEPADTTIFESGSHKINTTISIINP